jgi:hypothetical protein
VNKINLKKKKVYCCKLLMDFLFFFVSVQTMGYFNMSISQWKIIHFMLGLCTHVLKNILVGPNNIYINYLD